MKKVVKWSARKCKALTERFISKKCFSIKRSIFNGNKQFFVSTFQREVEKLFDVIKNTKIINKLLQLLNCIEFNLVFVPTIGRPYEYLNKLSLSLNSTMNWSIIIVVETAQYHESARELSWNLDHVYFKCQNAGIWFINELAQKCTIQITFNVFSLYKLHDTTKL